jgi:predicted CXXCH cytochrome family protein
MSTPADQKSNFVVAGLVVLFLALGASFAFSPDTAPIRQDPAVSKIVTPAPKVATLRISATQLKANGGDTSGLDCYACHDEKKPPTVKMGADGSVVFPKEHGDLRLMMANCDACHVNKKLEVEYEKDGAVKMPKAHEDLLSMGHGRNNRNTNCFNCHSQSKLNELVTRDGTKLTFDQAPLLCASCHGPTYRDWELGVHGRTNGYWDTTKGKAVRQDCNSCHDPHGPAIPQVIPLPGPKLVLTHGLGSAPSHGHEEEAEKPAVQPAKAEAK